MSTLHPTFDIPMEFIENSINIGVQLAEASQRGEKKYIDDFEENKRLRNEKEQKRLELLKQLQELDREIKPIDKDDLPF